MGKLSSVSLTAGEFPIFPETQDAHRFRPILAARGAARRQKGPSTRLDLCCDSSAVVWPQQRRLSTGSEHKLPFLTGRALVEFATLSVSGQCRNGSVTVPCIVPSRARVVSQAEHVGSCRSLACGLSCLCRGPGVATPLLDRHPPRWSLDEKRMVLPGPFFCAPRC